MRAKSEPRSPLVVTAIQLGLLLVTSYYTFIGGQTAHGIYDPTWRSITLWLTTLLLGSWLLWRLRSRTRIPRLPLERPILFLLFIWVLATLFSVNPTYSRETFVFFGIYLFVFYLAADLGRWPWFTELMFNAILATSGLVWTLGLLQLQWWYQGRSLVGAGEPVPLFALKGLGELPRLSVLGNSNTLASYLALVIPLALYKAITVRRTITRVLVGLWLAMLLVVMLLTQSRGGLLGLFVAVAFFAVVVAGSKTRGWLTWPGSTPGETGGQARLAGKVLGLGAVVTFAGLAGVILVQRGMSEGTNFRQQVLAGAIKTLASHPILGSGPGTLGEELLRHQQPLDAIWTDAHNLFMTLAAETGLLGAAGLVWLAGAGLWLLARSLRQVERTEWPLAGLACAAALLGFSTHNLVDSLFKYPLIMLLVALLAGFWLSATLQVLNRAANPTGQPGWPTLAVLAALGGLALNTALGWYGLQNISLYNQAVEAAGRADWSTSLAYLNRASQLAPEVPFYTSQSGFVLGYLSQQQPADRPEAINAYRSALAQLEPVAIDQANLACLLAEEGRLEEARQAMSRAQQLQPDNLIYRLNLAYYLEIEGESEAAQDEYARFLATWPDYAQSAYWSQTEFRTRTWPEIFTRAASRLAGLPAQLIRLYLAAGQVEAARAVYEESARQNLFDPFSLSLYKGRVLWALGRPDEARAEFEAARDLNPQADEPYLYLSQVDLARGDLAAAGRNADIARYLAEDGQSLYWSGRAAAARGDLTTALERYEAAFNTVTTPLELRSNPYATEVARRRPLPALLLPCLVRVYPTRLLVAIAEAEGDLLESQGNYGQAGQVYRRLLALEPTAATVEARLAALCGQHAELCGN